jgi:HAMP domain-containing protein
MTRLNIRMKLLFVFMSIFTVFLAGVFIWFYQFSTARLMDELRKSLVVTASTAAQMVSAGEHTFVFESGLDNSTEYEHIATALRLARDANPRATAVYTAVKSPNGNPNELLFVVSANENVEERAKLCEVYDASNAPEMLKGFEGPIADQEMGQDEFGNWLSGYAPILNNKGEAVAIVGVDMFADEVLQLRNRILTVSIAVFLLAFASVFLAALFVSGAISKPLTQITDAARLLENDQPYDPNQLKGLTDNKDELGILAHVFNEMAVQVQQREQKLKEQVVQLRIEIDETKRKKQVSEIVDTEYFQELRQKTQDLRRKRSSENKE